MSLSLSFLAPSSFSCSLPKRLQKNQQQAIHVKCMAGNQAFNSMETERRSANYQPSIWHYDFIQLLEISDDKWANLCKSFLVEAKWYKNGYIPTLEEYLENAWISSSGPVILFFAYFLLGQEITQEAVQCLENQPKIICFPSMILRLCNDLVSSKAEQERGDVVESIQCYMKQAGVSEEIARGHIKGLITSTWTKLNSECYSSSSHFPQPFINTCINLARMSQCMYQYGDGHSAPNKESKNAIIRSLVESIQLQQ